MSLQLALSSGASNVFAATKTTSNSGGVGFYIILLLLVGLYFFYLRPRRGKLLARQREANQASGPAEIQPGDTVLTTSGIIGRVLSIDGDRASVEIAPDTVIEFHKSTLGRRLEPETPDEGDRWADLASHEEDEHGGTSGEPASDAGERHDTERGHSGEEEPGEAE